MSLVTLDNFIGKFILSINEENGIEVQLYIDRLENSLLRELFGVDLFNLWYESTNPIYTILNEPMTFQTDCGTIYESKGIIDMLTGFIYWEIQRDIYTQQTVDGPMKNSGENSTNSSFIMANLQGRYSDALRSYEAIQEYIRINCTIYPEFKGIEKYTVIPYF